MQTIHDVNKYVALLLLVIPIRYMKITPLNTNTRFCLAISLFHWKTSQETIRQHRATHLEQNSRIKNGIFLFISLLSRIQRDLYQRMTEVRPIQKNLYPFYLQVIFTFPLNTAIAAPIFLPSIISSNINFTMN